MQFVLTNFRIVENENIAASFNVQMPEICLHGLSLARLNEQRSSVFMRVPKLKHVSGDSPTCTLGTDLYAAIKAAAIEQFNQLRPETAVVACTKRERRLAAIARPPTETVPLTGVAFLAIQPREAP